MKKILLILLLFPLALFGQKISELPVGTEPDADDVFPMNIDGTTSKVTKSLLTKSVRDSVEANSTSTIDQQTLINILWDEVFGDPRPDADLQFFYKFEEDTLDESGYTRDFTTSAGFTYADPNDSETNFAGNFDTITRYVTVPSFNQTSFFTVSMDAFVYNDSSGNRTLMSGDGWRVAVSGDTVKFITSMDSTYCVDAFDVDTIRFRHIHLLVTHEGEIWVDGVEQTVAGSIAGGYDAFGPIVIGQASSGAEPFYGYLDNVKLYTGVMTDAEKVVDNEASDRYVVPDITNPVITTAAVNIPTAIIVRFSEPVYNFVEDSLIDALTYTANELPLGIDSIIYYSSGNNIAIYTDSVAEGSLLKLSYLSGDYSGLRDWSGNILLPISEFPVTNNYVQPIVDVAVWHYSFDGNGVDNIGGYTAVDTSVTWSPTVFVEGTQSVQLNGSSYKLWIPSSYDTNPDTLSVSLRIRLTSNASSWTVMENFSATPFNIEWRAAGNDIRVYVGASYAQATNIAGSSDPTPTGAWRHLVVTFVKSTGTTAIYVDGVDETDDATSATGADLTGPFRLYGITRGYLDDLQGYEVELTSDEVTYLYNNIGEVAQRQGNPDTDPPDPVNNVIDTLFYFDFEDSDLGWYSRDQYIADFNPSSVGSSGWTYSGLTNSTKPWIVAYDVKIDGVATTSQGWRLTKVAGTYFDDQTVLTSRVPLPDKANNTDVYVQFDIKCLSPGWSSMVNGLSLAGKTIGLWADWLPDKDKNIAVRENARWTDDNATKHHHTGYFGYNTAIPEIQTPWHDSNGGTVYMPHSTNLDSMYRITVRMVTGPNGFTEFFYNSLLVGTNYDHGKDMTGMLVDILKMGFTFNTNDTPPQNVVIIYDNILVYRYDPGYSSGLWMQKSPPGWVLYTPIPTYR